MVNVKLLPHTYLYNVRVWLEDLGEGQTEWRGEVHDVVSGERRFFRTWPALIATLQAMLPRPDSAGLEQ